MPLFNSKSSSDSQKKNNFWSKCLQLTGIKSLCVQKNANVTSDYEFISYENVIEETHNPVTTTMIDPSVGMIIKPRVDMTNIIERSSLDSLSDATITNSFSSDYETEQMRRHCTQLIQARQNYTYVVRGSISTDKSDLLGKRESIDNQTHQLDMTYDFLHSTKIGFNLTQTEESITRNLHKWPMSPLPCSARHDSTIEKTSDYHTACDDNSKNTFNCCDTDVSEMIDSLSESLQHSTHICTAGYEASFVGDCTVAVADTVRILRDCNNDWLYIQVADDGREGYVPKSIVIDLQDFLSKLKDYQEKILAQQSNATTESYIFPCKV